jgi:hypothetical protein
MTSAGDVLLSGRVDRQFWMRLAPLLFVILASQSHTNDITLYSRVNN